jgi:multicomponent Na+:H+ antiporter subunit B
MPELINLSLLVFLVIITVVIIRQRDLFTAVMLSGIFSLLCAGLFTVMDAVDVAFTEAAVGAGISTVLMLAALSMTSTKEKEHPTNWGALGVSLLIGALLVYGTTDMPAYGDPEAPVHNHIAKRYIEESPKEIGVPNMVTSLLASYRGFDTLGETTVVLTACIGVLLLLGGRKEEEDDHEGA